MAANYQETRVYRCLISGFVEELRSQRFCSVLNLELKSENPLPTGVWYRFHHGMSMASYGEKITVTLNAMNDGSLQVTIHSECGMPTQVVDWGKNKSNVEVIFNYLESTVVNNNQYFVNANASVDQSAQYNPQNSQAGSEFSNTASPDNGYGQNPQYNANMQNNAYGQNPQYNPNMQNNAYGQYSGYAQNNQGYNPNNNGYGYNPQNAGYYENPVKEEKQPCKGLAIASMVLGFISFMCYGYLTGIISIIFAIVAKSCGNKSRMATTGLICSIIAIVLWTLLFVLIGVTSSGA